MGCRAIAASAAIGIGVYQTAKTIVNAKEAEQAKATKVYGFIGIPDTHSLETYLKWKQIPYELEEINLLKIEDIFAETNCGMIIH